LLVPELSLRVLAAPAQLPAVRQQLQDEAEDEIFMLGGKGACWESSSMSENDSEHSSRSFREMVKNGMKDDGYEPQLLWLIPIFLRPRIQYYDEAAADIHRRTDEYWSRSGQQVYGSREEFEQSSLVQWIWDSGHPYWWGFNDIVGWIDVRACVRSQEIQVSLFLPSKRVSRKLKDKRFVFRRREVVALPQVTTNEQLRKGVFEAVEVIRGDDRIKKRYVDLDQWRRLVRHTDLVGIIREAANEDLERSSTEEERD
jgi:hypothetical protein